MNDPCEEYQPAGSIFGSTRARRKQAKFIKHLLIWSVLIFAFLPLILITDPWKQMLSVGLMQLDSQYVKQYGQLMAAYMIASIPLIILFLFSMKAFICGLMGGAVKG